MAQIPLQIWWNNFTSWENDQIYQAQAWRYYKWYWVDTQRYDVKPMNWSSLLHTYWNIITSVFNTEKVTWTSNNIVWLNNWTIYKNWTLASTITTNWKTWYAIWYMKPIGSSDYKLYLFSFNPPNTATKYIHRTDIDWAWISEWYRTYSSTDWNPFFVPPWQPWPTIVLNLWDRILFTYYNQVWQLSNSEVVSLLLTLPSEENIVWLTQFQWEYKIYTTVAESTSRIYQWDWLNSLPTVNVNLNWIAITWWVANNWAYDYFRWDWSLYQVAWVQYQKLYNKISWRIVWAFDDKIIVERSYNWKACLCEYSMLPWYNKWLHPKTIIDITNQSEMINSFDYNSLWMIFWSTTKLFNNYWTPQSWTISNYIESIVFVWDNIQYEKTITEIILKFSWFSTQNIVLYCMIQENNTWIKLFDWNNNTISTQNHWVKIPSISFLNPVWKFNTIRFKIEFPHTWTSQWRFYWLDLFGNQDIWK